MTRFGLILLASCVPLTTSTTTTPAPARSGPHTAIGDERAAMYEREQPPATSHEQPGVPLDPTPRPCIPAQNHCMRGGWFLSQSSATTGPQRAVPAYPTSETAWLDYRGAKVVGDYDLEYGHAMRTAAATTKNIKWGRPVIALCPKAGTWPASEAEMLTSPDWYLVVARSIDEAAGTIELGRDGNEVCPVSLPITNVRAIVEFKNAH